MTTQNTYALRVTHRGRTINVPIDHGKTLVIGRSQSCDLFLDDAQISRRHIAIHNRAGVLQVEDLGSHNGTLLLASVAHSEDETQTRRSAEVRLLPNLMTSLPDDALVQIGSALITVVVASATRAPRTDTGFVVVDPAMDRVLELADRVAPTDLTVLVLGESGAGKEVLAQYVHRRSPRAARRLVSLNCGALPENLLESELFGHEKGSFTGATSAKPGLLEAADGGTLFLDEIGDLPLQLQVKLLRILEDRQVWRVGALEPRAVDVRFVAATNRELEQHVASGKFREDLYYRLCAITLQIPPLRERLQDIEPLAERFIRDFTAANGTPTPHLARDARDKLRAHAWPGNVRQLKNVVQRALVMVAGDEITAADLELQDAASVTPPPGLDNPERLRDLADDAERRQILEAIEACAGNQTRAAQLLGITRRALVRRLEKYNLPRPRRPRDDA